MKNIALQANIDVSSFSLRKSKITSGIIYCVFDGLCYPSDDWYDAPILILSWWITSYEKFKYSSSCEFIFMEGDISIKMEKIENKVKISLFDNGQCDGEYDYTDFDYLMCLIKNALSSAAEAIVSSSWEHGDRETREYATIEKWLKDNKPSGNE